MKSVMPHRTLYLIILVHVTVKRVFLKKIVYVSHVTKAVKLVQTLQHANNVMILEIK